MDILKSKKFIAAIIASLGTFFGLMNGLTVEEIAVAISPILSYILAQGVADAGKERAKIEKGNNQ